MNRPMTPEQVEEARGLIERPYFDRNDVPRTLDEMINLEPDWAASRFRHMETIVIPQLKEQVETERKFTFKYENLFAKEEMRRKELQEEVLDITERLKDTLHDKVISDAKYLGEIEQLTEQNANYKDQITALVKEKHRREE